jgi:hypothetical protein
MTHHYKLPLVVLLVLIATTYVIMTRVPPNSADLKPSSRIGRKRSAKAARRLGWIYVAGAVVWLLSDGYKGLPLWLIPLLLGFSGFLIWSSFNLAKRIENLPTKDVEGPS